MIGSLQVAVKQGANSFLKFVKMHGHAHRSSSEWRAELFLLFASLPDEQFCCCRACVYLYLYWYRYVVPYDTAGISARLFFFVARRIQGANGTHVSIMGRGQRKAANVVAPPFAPLTHTVPHYVPYVPVSHAAVPVQVRVESDHTACPALGTVGPSLSLC